MEESKTESSSSKFGSKLSAPMVDPICFIELEMTARDPRMAGIAEIAVYLVSGDLKEQYQIANMVILNSREAITQEDIVDRFKKNGLWNEIEDEKVAMDIEDAENLLLQ
jgi:oligoribonuclease (3'-5' exoribonuclease)